MPSRLAATSAATSPPSSENPRHPVPLPVACARQAPWSASSHGLRGMLGHSDVAVDAGEGVEADKGVAVAAKQQLSPWMVEGKTAGRTESHALEQRHAAAWGHASGHTQGLLIARVGGAEAATSLPPPPPWPSPCSLSESLRMHKKVLIAREACGIWMSRCCSANPPASAACDDMHVSGVKLGTAHVSSVRARVRARSRLAEPRVVAE